MNTCYAVAHGFKRGIFEEWNETRKQIDDFPQPVFKKFSQKIDAQKYLEEHMPRKIELVHPGPNFKKYYAVARGHVVGVFTNFEDVREYIRDYPQPLYKKFDNLNGAISFFEKFFNGVIRPSKDDEERQMVNGNKHEVGVYNKEGISKLTHYAVAYGHEAGVNAKYEEFDDGEVGNILVKKVKSEDDEVVISYTKLS